jgi:hypothetical protein
LAREIAPLPEAAKPIKRSCLETLRRVSLIPVYLPKIGSETISLIVTNSISASTKAMPVLNAHS